MGKLSEMRSLYSYWKKHPIASKDMNTTVKTFIKWQLATSILKKPVVWSWLKDTRLVVEKGMTGATMNLYCGLHEFYDMSLLLHFLRKEDVFVDIGANIGSYTILASGVVGAKSIAIEPIPSTFKRLRDNITINYLEERTELLCCGVGQKDGAFIDFIADQDTTNRVAPEGYKGSVEKIPIHSLDNILGQREKGIFWKIDVEGYEEETLLGALNALRDQELRVILIETTNKSIVACLQEHGFYEYNYDPFTRQLMKIDPKGRKGHNSLYVRDIEFVKKRCEEGTKIEVKGIYF